MISRDLVVSTLEDIVADVSDDYTYEIPEFEGSTGDCLYATPDGKPSCLAGHVLSRLSSEAFSIAQTYEGTDVMNISHLRRFFKPNALRVLGTVQDLQDSETPWKLAVKESANEA